MRLAAPVPTGPAEPTIEEAARRMATASKPMALGAWREVTRTGTLAQDPEPDSTAAGLVRRWHQHLAVVIDLPMERYAPGPERLPALLTEWLDLARRTAPVRAHVARVGRERTAAEAGRQSALLARLLADDLAVLGSAEPGRSAADLVRSLAGVAAAEDAAGHVLRDARAVLLAATGVPSPAPARRRLLCRLTDRLGTRLHAAAA